MIVNIHEAKTHFSKLVARVLNGEEIIIAKGNIPVAKLSPYTQEKPNRKGGQLKGIMHISEDFDAPLPKDFLDSFYEG